MIRTLLDNMWVSPYADGRTWYVLTPFAYSSNLLAGKVFVVPTGFTTDFSSMPPLLWHLIPRWGGYSKALIMHDYLYYWQALNRELADKLFMEALEKLEIPPLYRLLFRACTLLWGGIAWSRLRRQKARGYIKIAYQPPASCLSLPGK